MFQSTDAMELQGEHGKPLAGVSERDHADMHRLGKEQEFRVCYSYAIRCNLGLSTDDVLAELWRRDHKLVCSGCDDGFRVHSSVCSL